MLLDTLTGLHIEWRKTHLRPMWEKRGWIVHVPVRVPFDLTEIPIGQKVTIPRKPSFSFPFCLVFGALSLNNGLSVTSGRLARMDSFHSHSTYY